ncbi:MAG: hypothetical protein HYV63_32290 [Candidatus Schekmanbacteria bacterium]|nr:hypothetical protein [Candidatus Schekmanbacteria bacterium]
MSPCAGRLMTTASTNGRLSPAPVDNIAAPAQRPAQGATTSPPPARLIGSTWAGERFSGTFRDFAT